MLTVAESSNKVFELLIGINDRFVWVLIISSYSYQLQDTNVQYIIAFNSCVLGLCVSLLSITK